MPKCAPSSLATLSAAAISTSTEQGQDQQEQTITMKRRDFLAAALATGPAAVVAVGGTRQTTDSMSNRSSEAVRVAAGDDRFGEKIKLLGGSPNDCKVSTKDTDGSMSVFMNTVARKSAATPCPSRSGGVVLRPGGGV